MSVGLDLATCFVVETCRTVGDYYVVHANAVRIDDVSPWLSELAGELIAEPDAESND